jgi:hypothetical protein
MSQKAKEAEEKETKDLAKEEL